MYLWCIGWQYMMLFICESCVFFFFKQKTAYEMRISDWSSDVCSSDPGRRRAGCQRFGGSADDGGGGRGPLSLVGKVETFAMTVIPAAARGRKIGRASCRERVCQYV